MRDIKFRVFLNSFMHKIKNLENIDSTSNLMQYTGLKDKNGKEIFEGDILKHKYFIMSGPIFEDELDGPQKRCKEIKKEDGTTEIIFLPPDINYFNRVLVNKTLYEEEEIFKVKLPNFYYKLEQIRNGCCYKTCKKTAKYFEIIGNIYENQDLLKEIK